MRVPKAMPRRAAFHESKEAYLTRLRMKSDNSMETWRKDLDGFERTAVQLGLRKSPARWSLEDIQRFLEAREWRGDGQRRSNRSIINQTYLLSKFLRFCGNYDLDRALEYKDVRLPPDTRPNRRWHSLEEVARLRAMARYLGDGVALMAIQLGLDAYLRGSEMVNLEVRDVVGDLLLVRQGKGRKDRTVHVTSRTRKDLDEYLSVHRCRLVGGSDIPHLLVIHGPGGPRPFANQDILSDRIRRIGALCDPPIRASSHDLRRTGAKLTYMANPTDRTVRDLQAALGHTTTQQTRDYIGTDVVDQAETFRVRDAYLEKMYPAEFSQQVAQG